MAINFSVRDKAILVGLYLSKFDKEALQSLGFTTINEAFNALGYSIGAKPSSLKNYRDEFDPYFPNERKGWHKRPIREYCKKILDDFSALELIPFTELIKSFVFNNYEIEKLLEKFEEKGKSDSVAKRLITGKAAEEYFKMNYHLVSVFSSYLLEDTTNLACGFDFKLALDFNYYYVEVKGLNNPMGGISMTEKEFFIARNLKEKYCLFIVSNFIDKPIHQYIFDPVNSRLKFKKVDNQIIQTSYRTSI